jgi:hypothetical protein
MNRNSATISPTPPAFTRDLKGAKYHGRNALDVAQNVGRVVEAIVLSPVHLVQQVTGYHDQPVRWIRPSRHRQRVAARPEGEQDHDAAAIRKLMVELGYERPAEEPLPAQNQPKRRKPGLGDWLLMPYVLRKDAAAWEEYERAERAELERMVASIYQPMSAGPVARHPASPFTEPLHLDRDTDSSTEPAG